MMKVDKIWDRIKSKELANGRFVLFGLIMLLIAIAIIQNFVGLQSLFLPRNIMNGIIAADNSSAILSVVTTLYRAIPFVTFFIILYFVSNHPTLQFKLFFILSGIVFIVTSNPLSTPRYWFGSTFLAIGYFLLRKKILNISFSWFLLVTLSIVYPFSDVFRRSLLVKTSIFDRSILLSMQHGFVYKPDFNSFQMLMNSVEYVRDFGFFYGQQIFGALFFWVPRVLWSDKPESTGEIIAADRNYPITNLDSPLMSEGYVDFGIIGLICYMFIHGFLIKRLDRILIRDTGDVKYLFALFFSFYQIFFLRGTLMVAVSCLAPLVLIFLFYDKAVFKESRT
ncbi:O-antigen polymerase [Marinoscillum sp.]|uniref:O-antigen polymerase n=1 Tax=Marinoscillum sp. TaxID=2024838 RepID=UPI003BAD0281